MKRRSIGAATAILAAVLLFPVKGFGISAASALVLDAGTGRVLYEKNADQPSLIASTTKIMTALVVCEQCNVLDRMRIPEEAVGIEGSSMYLQAGEVLTVQELLYGLMLRSGNDAAVALAIYCGGTVEDFVALMNDKAHRLGLENTHFENPNGLDAPGHRSTARDLAVLAAYAMENPIFRQTVSAKTVTIGSRSLRNHNKLLWRYEGAEGVKTGYTKAAGRILVSAASRAGRRLIAVTINAPDDWNDHVKMLDDGFSGYETKTVVEQGAVLGAVSVLGGGAEQVQVCAAEEFVYALRAEEKPDIILSGPGFTYAPVVQGGEAGTAYVMLDGKVIGRLSLYYAVTVEQKEIKARHFWDGWFGAKKS